MVQGANNITSNIDFVQNASLKSSLTWTDEILMCSRRWESRVDEELFVTYGSSHFTCFSSLWAKSLKFWPFIITWGISLCFIISSYALFASKQRCVKVLQNYLELRLVLCKARLFTLSAISMRHVKRVLFKVLITASRNVHPILLEMVKAFYRVIKYSKFNLNGVAIMKLVIKIHILTVA